ncbi:MAG: GerMN domain-containing protein [Treponema sp.]|nr:GerMN domain-containing protein [Treponema sp.]
MSEKGKKNKKKTGLGLAIWVLLFLIILIVFLVKQEEIKQNFDKSGATALIEKKIGKDVFDKKGEEEKEDSGETIINLNLDNRKKPVEEKEKSVKVSPQEEKNEVAGLEQTIENKNNKSQEKIEEKTESGAKKEIAQENKKAESKSETKTESSLSKKESSESKKTSETASKTESKSEVKNTNTLTKKICFVAIDSDGPVVRKQVSRSVSKDSPMGDALNMLLKGPSATEEKTGCRSLIPEGTRLLSASVKNGVAILNFSEEFQFNQFGAEGSLAQLMQVVYTATEFSTVKSVQIMIEGQKRDYLTEGVWIGSPLTRGSF